MVALANKPEEKMATAKPRQPKARVSMKAAYENAVKNYPNTMAYLGR